MFSELRRRMSTSNTNSGHLEFPGNSEADPFGEFDDDGFGDDDGGWNDFEEDAEHALSAQQTAEVKRLIGLQVRPLSLSLNPRRRSRVIAPAREARPSATKALVARSSRLAGVPSCGVPALTRRGPRAYATQADP